MSIKTENLTHIYMPGSPFEKTALNNVSVEIKNGEFVALIGHTGSGKSTLIQHFNGLLEATSGKIIVDGVDITDKKIKLTDIRKKVGLVFQYPEYQLFEETIAKDISFGPRNLGLSEDEIQKRVIESMEMVGLDYETYKDRSPFDLSGGQKRRVAIAGVIAMKPTTLILDEPTAGLDPLGHKSMMEMFIDLQQTTNITLVLVTHQMDDVAKYADNVIVMEKGTMVKNGTPAEVFADASWLDQKQLSLPQAMSFMAKIDSQLDVAMLTTEKPPLTVDELADYLLKIKAGIQVEEG